MFLEDIVLQGKFFSATPADTQTLIKTVSMGGCRCTYKNCTVRSDGKTHLFHYPVFDKVRCHEWLSKAGRYDFLNLKVSQLKNRCICQHHFTDDWFMNDKKEKLKLQAVPTLDGPYCDSNKFKDPEMPQNMLGVYPLACEVIENDDFILDRKSNYNVVYADFLTNSECMDTLNDCPDSTEVIERSKNLTDIENVTPITNNITEAGYKLRSANIVENKSKRTRVHVPQSPRPLPSALFVEIPPLSTEQKYENGTDKIKTEVPQLTDGQNNTEVSKTQNLPAQKKRSKVRIISEKNITDPEEKIRVPVSNALFEVVKPSMILNINKNKAKSKTDVATSKFNSVKEDPIVSNIVGKGMLNEMIAVPNIDKKDPIMLVDVVSNSYKKEESGITEVLTTTDPSKFEIELKLIETNLPAKLTPNQKKITKYKMSPERVAAINEKRKFNMKLKDIIAEKLNLLDEHNSGNRDTLIPKKRNNSKIGTETVMSSLSHDPSLPNEHAYIVHYLEARMEKMENLLLQKIDQNTKKIMDLKRTLDSQEDLPDSDNSSKKNMTDEAHKKHLFNEISKYLTPNSNSLIYEELFINKYVPSEHKAGVVSRTSKRKRNR